MEMAADTMQALTEASFHLTSKQEDVSIRGRGSRRKRDRGGSKRMTFLVMFEEGIAQFAMKCMTLRKDTKNRCSIHAWGRNVACRCVLPNVHSA